MTEAAVSQIKTLECGNSIRVRVEGGGCSGLTYKLEPTTNIDENDKVFLQDGVSLVIDPKSYLFLSGSVLDYSGGLNGTGFSLSNPNSKRTCGCGSSFAV